LLVTISGAKCDNVDNIDKKLSAAAGEGEASHKLRPGDAAAIAY
jgi:hypothetical protein